MNFIQTLFVLVFAFLPSIFADVNRDFPNIKGLKEFRKCGPNDLGNLTAVYISECDKEPCPLQKSRTYTTFFEGIFDEEHDTLTATFRANIGKKPIPFTMVNACDHIRNNLQCPFKKGVRYFFSLDFKLANIFISPDLATVFVSILVEDPKTHQQICGGINCVVL